MSNHHIPRAESRLGIVKDEVVKDKCIEGPDSLTDPPTKVCENELNDEHTDRNTINFINLGRIMMEKY